MRWFCPSKDLLTYQVWYIVIIIMLKSLDLYLKILGNWDLKKAGQAV